MNHEQELGNLLARIHRDGGQYIQKHGWQKAIADADALIVGWIHAAAAPVQAVPAEFQNPWRAALENCISGDNYLRASEYRELIEELDALYRLRAAAPAAPQVLAEPASGEFEIRKDGQRVRKDRWEWGIRRIVALLWGNRQQFEIDEVVDAVRELAPAPHADEEALARAVQEGAAPQPAERVPLTDELIAEISVSCALVTPSDIYFARAIERAHGIKPLNAQAERPARGQQETR